MPDCLTWYTWSPLLYITGIFSFRFLHLGTSTTSHSKLCIMNDIQYIRYRLCGYIIYHFIPYTNFRLILYGLQNYSKTLIFQCKTQIYTNTVVSWRKRVVSHTVSVISYLHGDMAIYSRRSRNCTLPRTDHRSSRRRERCECLGRPWCRAASSGIRHLTGCHWQQHSQISNLGTGESAPNRWHLGSSFSLLLLTEDVDTIRTRTNHELLRSVDGR